MRLVSFFFVASTFAGCANGVGFDSDCSVVDATGTTSDCAFIDYPTEDLLPVRYEVSYTGVVNGDSSGPIGDPVPFESVTTTVPDDSACEVVGTECTFGTCYLTFTQASYGNCRVRMRFQTDDGPETTCFIRPLARDEAEYERLDAEPYRCN
ncbi:MAG: hypothetical protein H6721_28100 [Sandaracinus sp.]|nr:hypothetical protein [Myxococcales bacterium]MCB9635991.1 hypothetical protein [Sandaracinus sp.]